MKYSVVVAEDEILLKNNLINKINGLALNFQVVGSAQTGVQGYDLVKDLEPDVLITDIRMPTMDGLTLIKEVHQHYPNVDCIIISGYSDFNYAKRAIHYQVTEYLLKPVDQDDLYTTLCHLQQKYQTREHSYKDVFNDTSTTKSAKEIAEMLHTYINTNYSEDIKINLIASELNYSASYLTKVFCNEYNCSPSKYLMSLRMQKAKQMLNHNPELTIRQIGEAIGYPEQGYFSRIFKKQNGMSPLDYRERN